MSTPKVWINGEWVDYPDVKVAIAHAVNPDKDTVLCIPVRGGGRPIKIVIKPTLPTNEEYLCNVFKVLERIFERGK